MIGVFYLMASVADWIFIILGKHEMERRSLLCVNHRFIVVNDGYGSLSLLFYTLVTYSYAVVMLFVFYHLPKKSGLVLDMGLGGDLLIRESSKSMVSQEKNAREFIRAMQGEERFLNHQIGSIDGLDDLDVENHQLSESWLR